MSEQPQKEINGISLMMTLEGPDKLEALKLWLAAPSTQQSLDDSFAAMGFVHYARFLPLGEPGTPLHRRALLLLIAEFDGESAEFLAAIANALAGPLARVRECLKNVPPVPHGSDRSALLAYLQGCIQTEASPFGAYKRSVRDIVGSSKTVLPRPRAAALDSDLDPTQQKRIGGGFNLVMEMDDPTKLKDLMGRLGDPAVKERIDTALRSLEYVHFARFLPIALPQPMPALPLNWPEQSLLLIVTEFDGVMQNYVMDFAAALDREFTMIIGYMKGRPVLPVSKHPAEFWNYVKRNLHEHPYLFSAYPDKTVLDIVGQTEIKRLPQRQEVPAATVEMSDVQANLLRGFGADKAFHFHLRFPDPDRARRFIAELRITPGSDKPAERGTCLNIGFTHEGLKALGLPSTLLDAFPEAFREGPARRARQVGDTDESDPRHWRFGGTDGPSVHAVVSVHCRPGTDAGEPLASMNALIKRHGVEALDPQEGGNLYAHKGEALPDRKVHFGYRDGISQPRIPGVHDMPRNGPGATAVPGDFLLGSEYLNSRGGRYIGALPPELAHNATYAAYRVVEQKVWEFDDWLERTASNHDEEPELVAAKLMGRWKNGTPLTSHDKPMPDDALDMVDLDNFDYVSPLATEDDRSGLRCPIGAHVRRLNPRSGMVLGVPWGRQVVRRGLPFGPAYVHPQRDDVSRGLVGMFMCGDLEAQFEFLLGVWGRQDLSSFGLRNTQDPLTGTSPHGTSFTFRSPSAGKDITVQVPPLTRTTGSLYLLMPGLCGLEWIASGEWAQPAPKGARMPAAPIDLPLNPSLPAFKKDPYATFAYLRDHHPVYKVAALHNSHWVLSHELVTEVCSEANQHRFLKPGHNRDPQQPPFGLGGGADDGLFFMDPPRHTEVRPLMDKVFAAALVPVLANLAPVSAQLLESLQGRSLAHKSPAEMVSGYASKLAAYAFMEIMGIPDKTFERPMVAAWTRAMLNGHDPALGRKAKASAGTSGLAVRTYFDALACEQARRDDTGVPPASIMAGLRVAGCPYSAPRLTPDEVTNTATHFALGGYLSTEFLIGTGIRNLLGNREQWDYLRDNPDRIRVALDEMLRYDAPFQMADRWVAEDCKLGDYPLCKGDKLTVVYASANRDPKVFDDPDRFDIHRKHNMDKAYGFGHGIHYCIGAPLGLAVAEVAIKTLLERFPETELVEQGPWMPDPYFRSLTHMTVTLA